MKKLLPLLLLPCLSLGQAVTIIKDTVIKLPKAFKHEANIETLGVVLSNGDVVYNGKPTASTADELQKLHKLYSDTVLTKDEYEAQRKKLLSK